MSLATYLLLAPLLALVAASYASVGLGGGTAYLSVVSLVDADPETLRPIAWSLNCVVAAIGFAQFLRRGHFDARLAWPFLAGGLAGAVAGASVPLDPGVFRGLLALALAALALRMLLARAGEGEGAVHARPWLPSLVIGAAVGGVSAMLGFGGGILLGPVLVATGWADPKRTAAITSVYILLNSAAALGTHVAGGGALDLGGLAVLGVAVALGGLAGATWGAGRASPAALRRVFGVVALVAAGKLGLGLLLELR